MILFTIWCPLSWYDCIAARSRLSPFGSVILRDVPLIEVLVTAIGPSYLSFIEEVNLFDSLDYSSCGRIALP